MPNINEVHDQYVVDVSLNNQVEAGAAAVVRALDAVQKSAQAAAADVSTSGEKVQAAYPQWDRLARKYDDVTAAANKLKNAEEALARAQEVSTIALQRGGDQEQVNRVLAEMTDRVTIARQSLLDLRAATDAAADAEDRWGGAMGQLRASVDSVFATSQRYAQQLDLIATVSETVGLSHEKEAILVDKLNAAYAAAAGPLQGYVNSTEQAAAAAAAATAANEAYQATLDTLQARYSATAAASQKFAQAEAEINLLEDEGRLSAEQASAALDKEAASFDKAAIAARNAAAAFKQAADATDLRALGFTPPPTTEQSTSRQADVQAAFGEGLTQAAAQYSAVTAAQARMSAETTKLNTLLNTGLITAKEYTAAMAGLQAEVNKASGVLPTLTDKVKSSEASMAQHQFATRQAGVQMIQFFTSIESGQPILIAFIQQLHQMVDVAVVTGTGFEAVTNAIKGAFSTIGGLIAANPITAGLIAISAAIVAVGVASEVTDRRLAAMSTTLSATRADFRTAAVSVVQSAHDIAASTSAGFGDALKAAQTLAAVPTFDATRKSLDDLVTSANGFAQVMGKTLPEAAKLMAQAFKEPGQVAKQLADEGFRGMDAATRLVIDGLERVGDKAGATNKVLEAMKTAEEGVTKTPLQESLEKLSQAFTKTGSDGRSFADMLGSVITHAASLAVDALTAVVNGIHAAIDAAAEATKNAAAAEDYSVLVPGAGVRGKQDIPALAAALRQAFPSLFLTSTAPVLTDTTPGVAPASIGRGVGQITVGTAAGYGVSQEFIDKNAGQNLSTMLAIIDDLQKNAAKISVLATDQSRYIEGRYGGFKQRPSETDAAFQGRLTTKMESLAQADISKLPTDIVGGVQMLAGVLKWPPWLTTLALQMIKGESQGQQFATPGAGVVAARQQQQAQAGVDLSKTIPTNATEIQRLTLEIDKLNAARQQAKDSHNEIAEKLISDQIAITTEQLKNAQQPTLERTRALADEARVAGVVGATQKQLLQAQIEIDNYNRQHPDRPFTSDEEIQRLKAVMDLSAAQVTSGTAVQSDEVKRLTENLRILTAEREKAKEAQDDVGEKRLSDAIAVTNEKLKDALDTSRERTIQLNNEARVTATVGEANKEVLRAKIEMDEHDRQHPDDVTSPEQRAARLNAVLAGQSAAYKALTVEQQRQIDANNKIADGWAGGAAGAEKARIQTEAFATAQKMAAGTGEQFNAIMNDQIRILDAAAASKAAPAAKQELAQLQDQVALVQFETATLGDNNLVREQKIAHMKEEQDLARRYPWEASKPMVEAILAESDALVRQNQVLQQNQAALSYLSNAFQQAFDTIGNAMTQAFIQGQGAAVNWRNVMTSVIQQVIQAFVKLAVVNPILNSLFGQSNVTLNTALNALGGAGGLSGGGPTDSTTNAGGGGSSLLNTGGNVLTGVSVLDKLGLTNIGGQISRLTDSIGLTGPGGLFNGVGSGISGFLSQGLFGTSVIEAGAPSFAAAAVNPTLIGSLPSAAGASGTFGATGILGGASIGQLAGGIGAGFGLGSLAGGFLQSSIGKTGYGPTIGAGLGSVGGAIIGSFVPVIGTVLGGILGGLLGGGGGGLIGPNVKNPYSLTNIGINAQGQLTTGASVFQKLDSNLAQTMADVKTVNDALSQAGVRISAVTNTNLAPGPIQIGPGGVPFFGAVGSANPRGGDDFFAANVGAAFSGFRFGSDDPRIAGFLKDKSYADPNALVQAVNTYKQQVKALSDFLDQTAALLKTKTTGTYQDSVDAINKAFGDQIDAAEKWKQSGIANADEMDRLTKAENDLTDARNKALDANLQAVRDLGSAQVAGLQGRYLTAQASVTGRPEDVLKASLYNFDAQATSQRAQLVAQWKEIFGDTYAASSEFVNSSAALEKTLGAERLLIQKQYDDALIQQAAQAATQRQNLYGRYLTARATVTGDPNDVLRANFFNIDNQAQQERDQLTQQYKGLFGDGYQANLDYIKTSIELEKTLGEERLAAQKQADDAIAAQAVAAARQQQGYYGRYLTALATVTGSAADSAVATLYNFDIQAQGERDQLASQYKALYGDAYRTNAQFVANSIGLEQALGEERLAIQKQADQAIIQQTEAARTAAAQSITSLVNYAHSLQFGSQSPLSPQAQLDLAQKQFNAVAGAARAGDANSINQVQTYAQSLLQAAQTFWGSGQAYVDIFNQVVDTLDAIATESPDTLTASYFALQTQTQTATLVEELQALRDEVVALRLQVASTTSTPGRIAA